MLAQCECQEQQAPKKYWKPALKKTLGARASRDDGSLCLAGQSLSGTMQLAIVTSTTQKIQMLWATMYEKPWGLVSKRGSPNPHFLFHQVDWQKTGLGHRFWAPPGGIKSVDRKQTQNLRCTPSCAHGRLDKRPRAEKNTWRAGVKR